MADLDQITLDRAGSVNERPSLLVAFAAKNNSACLDIKCAAYMELSTLQQQRSAKSILIHRHLRQSVDCRLNARRIITLTGLDNRLSRNVRKLHPAAHVA